MTTVDAAQRPRPAHQDQATPVASRVILPRDSTPVSGGAYPFASQRAASSSSIQLSEAEMRTAKVHLCNRRAALAVVRLHEDWEDRGRHPGIQRSRHKLSTLRLARLERLAQACASNVARLRPLLETSQAADENDNDLIDAVFSDADAESDGEAHEQSSASQPSTSTSSCSSRSGTHSRASARSSCGCFSSASSAGTAPSNSEVAAILGGLDQYLTQLTDLVQLMSTDQKHWRRDDASQEAAAGPSRDALPCPNPDCFSLGLKTSLSCGHALCYECVRKQHGCFVCAAHRVSGSTGSSLATMQMSKQQADPVRVLQKRWHGNLKRQVSNAQCVLAEQALVEKVVVV